LSVDEIREAKDSFEYAAGFRLGGDVSYDGLRSALAAYAPIPTPSPYQLLGALLAADAALGRVDRRRTRSSAEVLVPGGLGGGTITMWREGGFAVSGLRFFDPSLDARTRLVPAELYRPALRHTLSSIGYLRTIEGHVRLRFPDEAVLRELSERLERGGSGRAQDEFGASTIRVGLFSVCGDFEIPFRDTGGKAWSSSPGSSGGQVRGSRAATVERRDAYELRLREIVRVASRTDSGVDVLVLPEMMVDEAGLDIVREEIRSAARRDDAEPPALTIAGSTHLVAADGAARNASTVLDRTGRTVMEQVKHTTYASGETLQEYEVEDVEPSSDLWLLPTSVGTFAVLICSDFLMAIGSAGFARAAMDSSVGWIVVPAFTPKTGEFVRGATGFARDGRIVLFAASEHRLESKERWNKKEGDPPPAERPPGFLREPEAVGAFVNAPSRRPVGLWFDHPAPPTSKLSGCHIGISVQQAWEGLIVEFLRPGC
jgi:hypothetical protein